jgi:hypothetical protein
MAVGTDAVELIVGPDHMSATAEFESPCLS